MQRFLYLVCLVLSTQAMPAQSKVLYVSHGSTGSGSSWADASRDLRATLAGARAGDEVWVAGGTYAPTTCSPCGRDERLASFVLPKGVKLRGGFSGAESSPAQRSASAAATMLSGKISAGTEALASAYTILTVSDPTQGTLIEGISFDGGNATESGHGLSDPIVSGAQLDVFFTAGGSDSSRLEVRNCVFTNAKSLGYGGAVLVNADDGGRSEVIFRDCCFEGNASETGGGAVFLSAVRTGRDVSRFEACSFRQNACGFEGGGAIHWTGGDAGDVAGVIADCVFVGNESPDGGGGAVRVASLSGKASLAVAKTRFEGNGSRFGGAVEFDVRFGGAGDPSFSDVAFLNNRSGVDGGCFYANTNGDGRSDPSFERCVFRGNRSENSGGALYFNAFEGRSYPRLTDCRIEGNAAGLYGGAIYNFGRGGVVRPTLINTTIARNTGSSAGGIYALGSEGGDASATIINCAFVNNRATIGGALYSNANDEQGRSTPFVLNTIFQGNMAGTGATLRNVYGRPTLAYCSFDATDCEALRSGKGEQQICGPGNLFGVGDVFADTAAGDYRLRAGTIVVDAGLRDTLLARGVFFDLDSNARYRGATVDLGPIELASDPLAWSVAAESSDSVVCAGGTLGLIGTVDARFPTESFWSFGESRLSNLPMPEVTTSSVPGVEHYVFTLEAYGERISDSVRVRVTPRRTTGLTLDTSSLPDTLVVGRKYALSVQTTPADAVADVRWHLGRGSVLSTGPTFAFAPKLAGVDTLIAEASFTGACLDTSARAERVGFLAKLLSGVTTTLAAGGIEVLGNPVREVLWIGGLPAKRVTLEVYDVSGRSVTRAVVDGPGVAEVSMASVAPGTYVLVVDAAGVRYAGVVVRV